MAQHSFDEVLTRFREIPFSEDFDIIVAIADGGVIPAGILNQRLKVRLEVLRINLRDSNHRPLYDKPKLLSPIDFDVKGKRVLLVDDRIKSGATINLAKELMHEAAVVKTFAVNGNADYALYNEDCFKFPWIF
ncbi:MAG: phosphoribosyltransferase [Bacteroidales bacterium 36-12]|nr:MAG: phosphoribosyltransferase [Bacteroidales bacterium 36-12]